MRSKIGYTVPSEIAPYLDFIGGIQRFPSLKFAKSLSNKQVGDEPGFGVTPRILRDRYNVGDNLGNSTKNRQAVAQFLGQYYDPADLQEFFLAFFWLKKLIV